MTVRITLLSISFLLVGACGSNEGSENWGPFSEVALPVEAPSGQPRFFDAGDGLLMSWVETADDSAALRFATWRGSDWSAPQTAATGSDWFVNWADTPGVVRLGDGSYLGFYLQRTGPQPYAYGVRVVRSRDGQQWSEPIIPHEGRYPVEYGFVSIVPEDDGAARLFWLDGTAMYGGEGDEGAAGGHGAHGPMALRTALLRADGSLDERQLLDDRTCECCPTAAAATGAGTVVAYRDRSDDEIRDIAVVGLTVQGATAPSVPHPDGWQIAGCPVNGPALVADEDRLALAWFTGAEGGKVQVAFSDDGGRRFGPAVRVDEGRPTGRVSAALLESGEVLVSWLETGEEGGELRVRRVHPDGVAGASVVAAEVGPQRASGMPQLAVYGEEIWAAWVDASSPARVRAVRARVEELP